MGVVQGATSLSANAEERSHARPEPALDGPIEVRGKFLVLRKSDELGDRTFWVKGVTYGPFAPAGSPDEYGNAAQAARDFTSIADNGFNTIRTYTPPPLWLLDLAQRQGLRVMVGLAWEQHITFLNEPARLDDIMARVRAGVRQCAGHPAVLCYSVGNEIPTAIARWFGPHEIERWIERLCRVVKLENPN